MTKRKRRSVTGAEVRQADGDERIHELLNSARHGAPLPTEFRGETGLKRAVLAIYQEWKRRGGIHPLSGKPLNSYRALVRWQKKDPPDRHVTSLFSKLSPTGERLSEDDAKNLLKQLLEAWDFAHELQLPVNEIYPKHYTPIRNMSIEQSVERLVTEILRTESPVELVAQEAKALIVSSRHNSVLGPNHSDAIKTFWETVCDKVLTGALAADASKGREGRLEIWVVALGSLAHTDIDAFRSFANLQALAGALRALALFKRSDVEDLHWRWNQMRARAFVAVEGLSLTWLRKDLLPSLFREEILETRDMGPSTSVHEAITPFGAEALLPRSVVEWLNAVGNKSLHDLSDIPLVVTVKRAEDNSDNLAIHYEAIGNNRGFAVPSDDLGASKRTLAIENAYKPVPLSSPGDSYDLAFRTLYRAARYRQWQLGYGAQKDSREVIATGKSSIAKLRSLKFEVLPIEHFLSITQWLMDNEHAPGSGTQKQLTTSHTRPRK